MEKFKFVKQVEHMVKPSDVAAITFMQPMSGSLPKSLQLKMLEKSSKKYPYMGFVVEPYSTFIFYEIKDIEYAKELIPDGFELIKTKVFDDDEEKYYCVVGCFNIHTSAFWGSRMEFNVIAKSKETGLLSWVIIDFETNTLSYDKNRGLSGSTVISMVNTINYDGDVIIDMQSKNNKVKLNYNVNENEKKYLDQTLWLEGNLSVGYGRELSQNNSDTFSLIFDVDEVKYGYNAHNVSISECTWFEELYHKDNAVVVSFPYTQHFLSDSPGNYSNIKNESDMVNTKNNLDYDKLESYSSDDIVKSIKIGATLSISTIIVLLALLILK